MKIVIFVTLCLVMFVSTLPLEEPVADQNVLLEVLTLKSADESTAAREKRQFGSKKFS